MFFIIKKVENMSLVLEQKRRLDMQVSFCKLKHARPIFLGHTRELNLFGPSA
jgi:hypothetical protein